MNKKTVKLVLLVVLSVIIFSGFGSNVVTSVSMNDLKTVLQDSAMLNKRETSHSGEADFGIIYIDAQNVDGLPDYHIGVLTNITITLSSVEMLAIVPIPMILFASVLENQDTIDLQMDFFWGYIDKAPDEDISVGGFGRNINWEW